MGMVAEEYLFINFLKQGRFFEASLTWYITRQASINAWCSSSVPSRNWYLGGWSKLM